MGWEELSSRGRGKEWFLELYRAPPLPAVMGTMVVWRLGVLSADEVSLQWVTSDGLCDSGDVTLGGTALCLPQHFTALTDNFPSTSSKSIFLITLLSPTSEWHSFYFVLFLELFCREMKFIAFFSGAPRDSERKRSRQQQSTCWGLRFFADTVQNRNLGEKRTRVSKSKFQVISRFLNSPPEAS